VSHLGHATVGPPITKSAEALPSEATSVVIFSRQASDTLIPPTLADRHAFT